MTDSQDFLRKNKSRARKLENKKWVRNKGWVFVRKYQQFSENGQSTKEQL